MLYRIVVQIYTSAENRIGIGIGIGIRMGIGIE